MGAHVDLAFGLLVGACGGGGVDASSGSREAIGDVTGIGHVAFHVALCVQLSEQELAQLVAFLKALECGGKLEKPELP